MLTRTLRARALSVRARLRNRFPIPRVRPNAISMWRRAQNSDSRFAACARRGADIGATYVARRCACYKARGACLKILSAQMHAASARHRLIARPATHAPVLELQP